MNLLFKYPGFSEIFWFQKLLSEVILLKVGERVLLGEVQTPVLSKLDKLSFKHPI